MDGLGDLRGQCLKALRELSSLSGLGAGRLMVVGCSTSEVIGSRIGTDGSEGVAAEIWAALAIVQAEFGFDIAIQCCEHLNRALVVERDVLKRERLDEVAAVPVPGAGGAFAAIAYSRMQDPCLAESICADAGLDIGDTFVAMHLRRVVVPIRLSISSIGQAHLTAARTRPPLIGGERAVYRK
jgi:uncharacterized protein (TIGR01440 family)